MSGLVKVMNLLLLAAIAVVAYWAFLPLPVETSSEFRVSQGKEQASQVPEFPTLASFNGLLDQSLRPQLYDPPPAPPPPPPKIEPPPPIKVNLQLVGTFIEPGRRRALISVSDGKSETLGVGDTVTIHPGNILITDITGDRVLLQVRQPRVVQFTLTAKGAVEN